MSQAEINDRLAKFAEKVQSPKEQLRRKLHRGITELNHGSREVRVFGISVDIVERIEAFINGADDSDCERCLAILRE